MSSPTPDPMGPTDTVSPLVKDKVGDSENPRPPARISLLKYSRFASVVNILIGIALGCVVLMTLRHRLFQAATPAAWAEAHSMCATVNGEYICRSSDVVELIEEDEVPYGPPLTFDEEVTGSTHLPDVEIDFLSPHLNPGERSLYTAVNFPTSTSMLYFRSDDGPLAGSIAFETSAQPSDVIQVHIEMRYRCIDALRRTKIYPTSIDSGMAGLRIKSKQDSERREGRFKTEEAVKFYITVRFPSRPRKSLDRISLRTLMPNFVHAFGNLTDSVNFDSVSIQTTNAPIVSDLLSAGYLALRNSYAPITGRYNVTGALSILNHNSKIEIEAGIGYNYDAPETSNVGLKTSNAPITALFHLPQTQDKRNAGGRFTINARTKNAPLEITIPVAPFGSLLHLDASTTHKPATVKLPPQYEGTISASTSWSQANIEVETDSYEPKEQGERRLTRWIDSTSGGSTSRSAVWWRPEHYNGAHGLVDVATTFSKCVIKA